MKFSKLVIAAGAAALIVTSAAPAFAAGRPSLLAVPNTVYQGGTFALRAECPGATEHATISSRLLPQTITLSAGRGAHYAQVNVGLTVTPGAYQLTERCVSPYGAVKCQAYAWVTVLKHISPSHTSSGTKTAHKYLRRHGGPEVIINTGFGGMARFVGQHHPAGF